MATGDCGRTERTHHLDTQRPQLRARLLVTEARGGRPSRSASDATSKRSQDPFEQRLRIATVDRGMCRVVERSMGVELPGEVVDHDRWRERPVAAEEDVSGLREREQAR